jgi:hypothetical protein
VRRIAWTEQAKALRILHALHRFAESGSVDLTALQGDMNDSGAQRELLCVELPSKFRRDPIDVNCPVHGF